MARTHGIIGIDIGTESIKTVALEVVRGEDVPRVLGVGLASTQGIRKGIINDPETVAMAFRDAIGILQRSADIKHAGYAVGIGGGLAYQKSRGLVVISRADGEVSGEDIKRAISTSETNLSRNQNREVLHRIPISFRVDNETVTNDPLGLAGTKLEAEAFFITAYAHHVKGFFKVLDIAEVEAEHLVAGIYAMASTILSRREKEVGVVAIDLGAATTSLIIFEEGLPYSLEIIPWGSANITNDIATGFQISIDEAEKLKTNYGGVGSSISTFKKDDLVYGNYSRKKLAEIIEARLSDIFESVEKHLKKVDRAGLLPAGAVLVGGGANLSGITEFAKDFLKLPARVAAPENLGGFKDNVNNPAWAGAVGAALYALQDHHSPILRGRGGAIFRWLRAFLP